VLDVKVDLPHSYFDYFVETKAAPEWKHVAAIYPKRPSKRLSRQLATFTLHTTARALDEIDAPGLSRLARLLNRRIQPQSRRGWDD